MKNPSFLLITNDNNSNLTSESTQMNEKREIIRKAPFRFDKNAILRKSSASKHFATRTRHQNQYKKHLT